MNFYYSQDLEKLKAEIIKIRKISVSEGIKIHNEIFGHHPKFSSPEQWEKYTIIIGNRFCFLTGYKKGDYPHISLAGVLEDARGLGLFSKLVKYFIKLTGSNKFTISTYPEKYPTMYKRIKKYGKIIEKDDSKITAIINYPEQK